MLKEDEFRIKIADKGICLTILIDVDLKEAVVLGLYDGNVGELEAIGTALYKAGLALLQKH